MLEPHVILEQELTPPEGSFTAPIGSTFNINNSEYGELTLLVNDATNMSKYERCSECCLRDYEEYPSDDDNDLDLNDEHCNFGDTQTSLCGASTRSDKRDTYFTLVQS